MTTTFSKVPYLLSLFGAFMFTSCVESSEVLPGDATSKIYSVSDFDKVDIAGRYKVKIVKGSSCKVEISASPKDHGLLEVETIDEVLTVRYKKTKTQNYPIEVMITTPDLERFSAAGFLDESTIENFDGNSIVVEVDGEGRLELNKCDFTNLTIEANGDAIVNSLKSTAENAGATVNGTAILEVHVTNNLEAIVNGVGSIRYSGNPTVTKEINGVGTIKPI